jgi:hypothetical protein
VHAQPLSLYLPSRIKLWCTLQLRGQVHSSYSPLPLYVLCGMNHLLGFLLAHNPVWCLLCSTVFYDDEIEMECKIFSTDFMPLLYFCHRISSAELSSCLNPSTTPPPQVSPPSVTFFIQYITKFIRTFLIRDKVDTLWDKVFTETNFIRDKVHMVTKFGGGGGEAAI